MSVTRTGAVPDPGMPDLDGRPAWGRLQSLVREYNVDLYLNGHDHALTLAEDPEDPVAHTTRYVTCGAGSYADGGAACGAERPYVLYSNVDTIRGNCESATPGGTPHSGFVIIKVNRTGFEVCLLAGEGACGMYYVEWGEGAAVGRSACGVGGGGRAWWKYAGWGAGARGA